MLDVKIGGCAHNLSRTQISEVFRERGKSPFIESISTVPRRFGSTRKASSRDINLNFWHGTRRLRKNNTTH